MNILTPTPIGPVYAEFMQWVNTIKWSLIIAWVLFVAIAWTIFNYNVEQPAGTASMSGFIGSALILGPLVLMVPIIFQINSFRSDFYYWTVLLASSTAAAYAIFYAGA